MRITWVPFDYFGRRPDGSMTSTYASSRMRIIIPAQDLIKRGHKVNFATVATEQLTDAAINFCKHSQAVIFPKAFLAVHAMLADIARDAGAKVIFDICDNQFAGNLYAENARAMAKRADLITCNTESMAAIARQYSDAPCVVINDPYEGAAKPPRFAPDGNRLRLLWYGHESHLGNLCDDITSLATAAMRTPISLTLLSTPGKGMEDVCEAIAAQYGDSFKARFVPWSLDAQWRELEYADVVVISTRPNDLTVVKSPNRLVSALRAGRMVIAHSLPSYEPFANAAWLGPNLDEGIAWVLQHRDSISDRIAGAQKIIEEQFSPRVLGRQWELTIRQLVLGKMPHAQA